MRIEEAIKQSKPFKDPYEKLWVNLMYTQNQLMSRFQMFFKHFRVTSKQYNILRILKGAERPVSTSYIKDRMLEKSSDVSRIVDRMEYKGFVKKNVCETDKRLVDVELTAVGLQALEKINTKKYLQEGIINNLSVEEAEQLNTLLDKLRGNL